MPIPGGNEKKSPKDLNKNPEKSQPKIRNLVAKVFRTRDSQEQDGNAAQSDSRPAPLALAELEDGVPHLHGSRETDESLDTTRPPLPHMQCSNGSFKMVEDSTFVGSAPSIGSLVIAQLKDPKTPETQYIEASDTTDGEEEHGDENHDDDVKLGARFPERGTTWPTEVDFETRPVPKEMIKGQGPQYRLDTTNGARAVPIKAAFYANGVSDQEQINNGLKLGNPSSGHPLRKPLPAPPPGSPTFEQEVVDLYAKSLKKEPWTHNNDTNKIIEQAVAQVVNFASITHHKTFPAGRGLEEPADRPRAHAEDDAGAQRLQASHQQATLRLKTDHQRELDLKDQQIAQQQTQYQQALAEIAASSQRLTTAEGQLKGFRENFNDWRTTVQKVEKELEAKKACIEPLVTKLKSSEGEQDRLRSALETLEGQSTKQVTAHNSMVDGLEQQYKKRLEDQRRNMLAERQNDIQAERQNLSDRHQSELEKKESKHTKEILTLKDKHARELGRKDQERSKELASLRAKVETGGAEKQALIAASQYAEKTLKEQHASIVAQTKERYETARNRLQKEHEDEHESMTHDIENAMEAANKDMAKVKREHAGGLKKIKDTHDAAIAKSTEEHARELQKTNEAHDATIAKMLHDRESSETKLIVKHREEKEQLESQNLKLKEDLEVDTARLVETHEAAMAELAAEYGKEKRFMQRQIQELNAALLDRDEEGYQGTLFKSLGLPKKPDEKLRELFGEIQRMVEDLGRLSWRAKRTAWTEQVMNSIRGQHVLRVLKKAIIQDMVWALLFRTVFGSPFRIFGEEGQTLEKEWFEQCKQDHPSADEVFPWPAPGAQAERWRYMTMRECREALTKAASEFDPRTRLRNSFMSSVGNLASNLKDELGSIIELGMEESQLVDRLSKRAAAIWLDFAMHRCRIVLQLLGNGVQSPTEKVSRLQSGSLVLTVSPRLGRYGTAKGMELDRFITIDGCAGESLKIP